MKSRNTNQQRVTSALVLIMLSVSVLLNACAQNVMAQGNPMLYLPYAAQNSVKGFTPTPTVTPTSTSTPTPKPTSAPTQTPRPTQATVDVSMIHFSFVPTNITVSAGTTITWTNNDSVNHTVTADNGMFDSGIVGPGGEFSFTFDTVGTFLYYCKLHGAPGGIGMSGTVVVTP